MSCRMSVRQRLHVTSHSRREDGSRLHSSRRPWSRSWSLRGVWRCRPPLMCFNMASMPVQGVWLDEQQEKRQTGATALHAGSAGQWCLTAVFRCCRQLRGQCWRLQSSQRSGRWHST